MNELVPPYLGQAVMMWNAVQPSENWELLLPLRALQWLVLPESVSSSSALSSVLEHMSGALSSFYVGMYSEFVYHEAHTLW